jgi:SAM-dependent methyltransferase
MAIWAKEWNHNTFYHRHLLRLVPRRCGVALDVGSGDGKFARRLASVSQSVTAMDIDQRQIDRARSVCAGVSNIDFRHEGLLTTTLHEESFDLIAALAVVHHFPFENGLVKMASLLRGGGRMIVLGIWTDNVGRKDQFVNHLAGRVNRVLQSAWGPDEMNAPEAMPELSLQDVRRQSAQTLPGAFVSRRLLWRYVLVWDKPYLRNAN